MPWHTETDNAECTDPATPIAVVNDADGTVEGCYATELDAQDAINVLMEAQSSAEEEPADEPAEPAAPVEAHNVNGLPLARGVRPDRETRSGSLQMRASGDGSTLTVYGHAATFDQPYEVTDWLGTYTETIDRGAFDKTLTEADVRFYVDHEGVALARSSAGNLDLRTDETGLAYEARLPGKVSVVQDLGELMRAGIMRESSFAFQTVRDEWNKDYTERNVQEVKLYDVSVVSLPANPAALAGVRAALMVRSLAPDLWTPELAAGIGLAIREGKVLSESNASLVRDVVDMLQKLLDAAAPKGQNSARDERAMMVRRALVEVARRRR
jgi:HK97 family phage prohead protease